jgi:hypothetical protein
MAKQTNEYHPTGFNMAAVVMTSADTTIAKKIIDAGPNDSTINQFSIRSASSTAEIVEILLRDGTTNYVLTTATVPANAGTDGNTSSFDVLGIEFIYNASIQLKVGWSIYARPKSTLTGNLTFIAQATDY